MKRRCRAALVGAFVCIAGAPPHSSARDALVDLTSETAVEFGDIAFSPEKRQVTVGFRIRNGSERLLLKPLRLDVSDVRSKLGDVKPTTATLEFDGEIPARGLRHGEATRDKTIAFEFPEDSPPRIDRSAGEILTMAFKVHGR